MPTMKVTKGSGVKFTSKTLEIVEVMDEKFDVPTDR